MRRPSRTTGCPGPNFASRDSRPGHCASEAPPCCLIEGCSERGWASPGSARHSTPAAASGAAAAASAAVAAAAPVALAAVAVAAAAAAAQGCIHPCGVRGHRRERDDSSVVTFGRRRKSHRLALAEPCLPLPWTPGHAIREFRALHVQGAARGLGQSHREGPSQADAWRAGLGSYTCSACLLRLLSSSFPFPPLGHSSLPPL